MGRQLDEIKGFLKAQLQQELQQERERSSDELKKGLEQTEGKWTKSNIEAKWRWHDIRRMTLDEWSCQYNKSEKWDRNNSVHGGSLRSDMEVISSLPLDSDLNRDRVNGWKGAFKDSYGLSYDNLQQVINDIPDKVLLACNMRASALRLTFWENRKNDIKKNADIVIEEWLRNPNDPDLFKEGSTAQTSLTKIEKEWTRMLPPSDQKSGDQ
jgi:hypothetical protein